MASIYDTNDKAESLYGKGIEALGSSGGLVSVPWKSAGSLKSRKDYDPDLVNEAVRSRKSPEPVDPRTLRARQPHLRKDVIQHYMTSNEVFADQHQAGNRTPVVYVRHPDPGAPDWQVPDHMILSGHHRAAAALLRGEQFNAIVVHGGYGPKR